MAERTSARASVKLVSDAAREREVFKYYPTLYADSLSTKGIPEKRDLRTSADSILTGLAQLGAYQTRTERSFISFFDTTHQFIVAEAVPLTPLTPRLPSQDCPSPLSLCSSAIRRSQGICEILLGPRGGDPEKDPLELPLLLVPNLANDDRFKNKDYLKFGERLQFYAGVPIRTRRGINIGSYCVFSSKPPEDWNDRSTQCLRDISRAIMAHLEANRAHAGHRRAERMNRGLGSLVEGKSTLSGWRSGSHPGAFADDVDLEGALNATQQKLGEESQDGTKGGLDGEPHFPGLPDDHAGRRNWVKEDRNATSGSRAEGSTADGSITPGVVHGEFEDGKSHSETNAHVFSKAANIIREACEVAGCLFFDVTTGSYETLNVPQAADGNDTEVSNHQMLSTSSSDEGSAKSLNSSPDSVCPLIGFSTSTASSINGATLPTGEGALPAQFLAKLLRRYPDGKIFSFDSDGDLQSSDSSETDGLRKTAEDLSSSNRAPESVNENMSAVARRKHAKKGFSRTMEGSVIQQAFASARSVAFLPVWNSKTERWVAGGFVYTLTPTRVFSVEGELSFLKAFCSLIVAEIQSLEIRQADKAKSDVLGSLSHELRSPLHGVILGTELLNDTDLDVFQGNAAYTIETCSRTLLDTLDHLLDYSKVNSFSSTREKDTKATAPQRAHGRARSEALSKKALSCNFRLDAVIEEVVESMFAGFHFQHMSIKQASRYARMNSDNAARKRLDSAQALEQLNPDLNGGEGVGIQSRNVSVYLQIQPAGEWMFNLQIGAVRRIIMNIFGNSLKYTESGVICVSLSQERLPVKNRKAGRLIQLKVQDTGRGISTDYMQHKLYEPFAQEDNLVQGTGLGLSIVKKIVSQLKGRISVQSQVGLGTTTIVTLPLEQSKTQTEGLREEDEQFLQQIQELRGLRIRLAGFSSQRVNGDIAADEHTLLQRICQDSLGLELVSDSDTSCLTPDIVLWSENGLPDDFQSAVRNSRTPNVVVCRNPLTAYWRLTQSDLDKSNGVVEHISQPIGPRKLAKSLRMAYQRWAGLPRNFLLPEQSSQELQSPSETSMTQAPPATRGIESSGVSSVIEVLPKEAAIQADSSQTHTVTKPSQTPSDEGAVFLLVDDNHINLKVLAAYMRKLGCAYKTAADGKEALDAYLNASDRFKCVLMDISMPVMDGLEATRHIRAYESKNRMRAVPIIVLTGLASDSTYEQASASGVDVFLTKPTNWKALNEALESMKLK